MRLASCFCLSTASGVMAYVSLVEVFGEAKLNFEESFGSDKNADTKVGCFEPKITNQAPISCKFYIKRSS